MRWEDSEFMADAPTRQAPAPVVPPQPLTPIMPMFVSPVTLMAPMLSKLGYAAVKSGKPTFVRLPCFIC